MRRGSGRQNINKETNPFRSPKSPRPLRPGRCFLFMKQTTKVLTINIDHDDLMDISRAFHHMISGIDIQKMADAINILGLNSFKVTEENLNEEIQKCYGEVMDSLGPVNDDGSIDIDLLDYPSAGSGSLGFVLNLKFDKDKEGWLWTLNLEVASNYVYPAES